MTLASTWLPEVASNTWTWTWPARTCVSPPPLVPTIQATSFVPGIDTDPTGRSPSVVRQASGTPAVRTVLPDASLTVMSAADPKNAW